MFFRNLTFFRFPASLVLDHLGDGLVECLLQPVGGLALSSIGFVPVNTGTLLLHWCGDCAWMAVGSEERVLPSAAVAFAVATKVAEVERAEGRRLGGRARKRIKEDVLVDMLPRAFVKPGRCNAYIDRARGFIAIDTSSRKRAETVVSELRRALGSFPALPLAPEQSPAKVLTWWLRSHIGSGGSATAGGIGPFAIADACELRDPTDRGAIVKCQRQELGGDEIREHLDAGKQVVRLGLTFEDRLSFEIGEDLVVRKLKFLDGALDQLAEDSPESIDAELAARFALQSGEVGRLFHAMTKAFAIAEPQS